MAILRRLYRQPLQAPIERRGRNAKFLGGALTTAVAELQHHGDVRALRTCDRVAEMQAPGSVAADIFGQVLRVDTTLIDENDSSTWSVAGIAYGSFSAATLAHLHQLSEQYSG